MNFDMNTMMNLMSTMGGKGKNNGNTSSNSSADCPPASNSQGGIMPMLMNMMGGGNGGAGGMGNIANMLGGGNGGAGGMGNIANMLGGGNGGAGGMGNIANMLNMNGNGQGNTNEPQQNSQNQNNSNNWQNGQQNSQNQNNSNNWQSGQQNSQNPNGQTNSSNWQSGQQNGNFNRYNNFARENGLGQEVQSFSNREEPQSEPAPQNQDNGMSNLLPQLMNMMSQKPQASTMGESAEQKVDNTIKTENIPQNPQPMKNPQFFNDKLSQQKTQLMRTRNPFSSVAFAGFEMKSVLEKLQNYIKVSSA